MTKNSEELDKLWQLHHAAYLQGNGDVYKNQLIEASLLYIKVIANKIYSQLPPNIELDDLKSEGALGAIEAIKSFNPNKARFITHLDIRVRSKILDYLRREDWATRNIRLRYNQLEKAKSELEAGLGYKPTEKQLLKELSKNTYPVDSGYPKNSRRRIKGREKAKLIIKDAKNIKGRVYFPNLNSYEENKEGKKQTDLLEDKKAKNSLYEAQKKDLKELLIRGLTRAEKLIVVLYYCENMTQKEIGETLGLDESRISQIRSSLLSKLKDKLTGKELTLEDCLNNL